MSANGILDHIGQELEINSQGRKWKLSRLDLGVWDEFFKWARTALPNPLTVAHDQVTLLAREEFNIKRDEGLDTDMKAHLIRTNQDEQLFLSRTALDKATSALSFGSAETQTLIQSMRGMCQLLWLMMKKYQPEASPNDAYYVLMDIGEGEMQQIIDKAGGTTPNMGNDQAPVTAA